MAPNTEIKLIEAVGKWADKNFGNRRGAEWGIAEELGEACHCVLKRAQKIRGFECRNFFMEKFTDALADIMIYLSDYCYLRNAFYAMGRNQQMIVGINRDNPRDERLIVTHLFQACAQMLAFDIVMPGDKIPAAEIGAYNMVAQRICTGVECWAFIYEIDLRLAVASTWAKVGQRDWIANPQAPLPEQQ